VTQKQKERRLRILSLHLALVIIAYFGCMTLTLIACVICEEWYDLGGEYLISTPWTAVGIFWAALLCLKFLGNRTHEEHKALYYEIHGIEPPPPKPPRIQALEKTISNLRSQRSQNYVILFVCFLILTIIPSCDWVDAFGYLIAAPLVLYPLLALLVGLIIWDLVFISKRSKTLALMMEKGEGDG
jgi:hypothetical protein